jgi:hypothetical protein
MPGGIGGGVYGSGGGGASPGLIWLGVFGTAVSSGSPGSVDLSGIGDPAADQQFQLLLTNINVTVAALAACQIGVRFGTKATAGQYPWVIHTLTSGAGHTVTNSAGATEITMTPSAPLAQQMKDFEIWIDRPASLTWHQLRWVYTAFEDTTNVLYHVQGGGSEKTRNTFTTLTFLELSAGGGNYTITGEVYYFSTS